MDSASFSRSNSMHQAKDQLLRKVLHRELLRKASEKITEHQVLAALDQNGVLSKENSIQRKVSRCADLWRHNSYKSKAPALETIPSGNIPKAPPPPPGTRPPPKKGGPGPPPPPPGGKGKKGGPPPPPGRMGAKKLDPNAANRKKLKMLHWDKIRKASSGSLWQNMRSGDELSKIIDTKQLEELFKIQDSKKTIQKKGGSDNVVRLVEHRRSHNLAIQLGGLHKSNKEIRDALMEMDDNALTLDQLLALKMAVPSQKECRELTDYINGKHPDYKGQKDVGLLGPVEKYFLEVKDIPRLQQRIECFIFMRSYAELEEQVQTQLDMVNAAVGQIFTCNDLQVFLQTVLAVGNFLNSGTTKGGAIGFKLESLLALHNVKGLDKKTSLLRFCIEQGLRRSLSLGTLGLQLDQVTQAAEILIPSLEGLIEEAGENFQRVKLELQEIDSFIHNSNNKEKYPKYAMLLQKFMDKSYPQFESLSQECSKLTSTLQNLSHFFDEPYDSNDQLKILKVIKSFLEIFEVTIKQMFKEDPKKEKHDALKHFNSEHLPSVKRSKSIKVLARTSSS